MRCFRSLWAASFIPMAMACSVLAGEPEKSAPTPGAALPSATEVFQKAQAAAKGTKLYAYRAEYTTEGWVKDVVAEATGTVVIGHQSEHGIDRFSCNVKVKPPKSEETLEFTAGSNGDTFFLVDSKTKTVYEDMDPAVLGSQSRNIRRVVLSELGVPEPFSKEMKAEKTEVKGIAKVGEEECYEVFAAPPQSPELTWYFSKKDFLPRKLVRRLKNPEGLEGFTTLTLHELKTNPTEPKDPFKVVVPEGFNKTADFAP